MILIVGSISDIEKKMVAAQFSHLPKTTPLLRLSRASNSVRSKSASVPMKEIIPLQAGARFAFPK